MKTCLRILSIVTALVLLIQADMPAQEHVVFDLDSNRVAIDGNPRSISESGVVVGFGTPMAGPDEWRVTYWDSNGTTFYEPLQGDDLSLAYDITEQGMIVGESDYLFYNGVFTEFYPHATIWENGQSTALETLVQSGMGNFTLRYAHRVNEKGQILGFMRDEITYLARAFLFENGVITDLGSLKSGGNSEPGDMNEQGRIVGLSESNAGFNHAFLWVDGVLTDLHATYGIPGNVSEARGINEFGVIAGAADFRQNNTCTAAVWDNGTVIDLGVLGGGTSAESFARDINDHGTVVGNSLTSAGEQHAFIWRGAKMIDLNDLIPPNSDWVLNMAFGINNSGRIVGEGTYKGFLGRPFILVPAAQGRFTVFGVGCQGSDGFTPGLYGDGEVTPGNTISLAIVNGLGGAMGKLLFGTGTQIYSVAPGCDLQILPLLGLQWYLALDGNSPGEGTHVMDVTLPAGLPLVTITMQAIFLDPQGSGGFTVSNPLEAVIR